MVWPGSTRRSTPQVQLLLFLYTTGCFVLSMSRPALVDAATPLSFSFDFSNTSTYGLEDLRFEGDAALNGNLVDLTCKTPTQAINNTCTGRMSYKHPVPLYDNTIGKVASFSTSFTFSIKPYKAGGVEEGGMAFFLSGYPSRLPPGSEGGYLGLDDGKTALGPNRYAAVEFDNYNNTWDPTGTEDHLSIVINSVRSSSNTTNLPSSSLNGTMTASISFNSTTKMLIVSLESHDLPSLRPAQVSLQLPDDITSLLPPEVAMGFSAATGTSFKFHQIKSWSFNSTLARPQKTKATANSSVMPSPIIPVALPVLNGSNYSEWKEQLLLYLGCADLDLALRVDQPAALTAESDANAIAHFEKWQRSNRISLMLIKTQVAKNIRSSITDSPTAKGYLTSIEQQFVSSDKALASTLMAKLSSLKYSGGSIREHIMEMRDIASQLKGLEVTFSDSFLVHYILNSLPPEYGPFKISYNTHKENWSINELLTMCVQEEGRLAQEKQTTVNTVDMVSHKEGKKRTWNSNFKGNRGPAYKKAKDVPVGVNQQKDKGVACFFCKKVGHVKKDCHKYQRWLEKKGLPKPEKAKQE